MDIGPFVENYKYQKDQDTIDKTVVLFPAETTNNVLIDKEEILDAKWVNLEDLVALLTYAEAKNAAENFIQSFSEK